MNSDSSASLVHIRKGVISSIDTDRKALAQRLLSMGFTPGTQVQVLGRPHRSSPMRIAVGNVRAAIRPDDAECIKLGGASVRPSRFRLSKRTVSLSRPLTKTIRIALVGNPNCGKTTVFNALTGSVQYVGNWPGVTVEKKEGTIELSDGNTAILADLPGIYSLTAPFAEEEAAAEYLRTASPDCIINIADAFNLRRSLCLTLQLCSLNIPVVLGVNFMDEAERRGDVIDFQKLSSELGIPVIPIAARDRRNIDLLVKEALSAVRSGCMTVSCAPPGASSAELDFLAREICDTCVRSSSPEGSVTLSDRVDGLLSTGFFSLLFCAAVMASMFYITFGPVGSKLAVITGEFIGGAVGEPVIGFLVHLGASRHIISLVRDGILSGVSGVLEFLPQIALLFLFMAILEDSGYMARTAVITDGIMRRFGLSGKAFIPMLVGFGCTVPAVFAARCMDTKRGQRALVILLPFICCSAKLPVYVMLTSAFFGGRSVIVIPLLWALGLGAAAFCGVLQSKMLFHDASSNFLIELPPYRLPTPVNVLRRVWQRTRGFLIKASTVIFTFSIILWFLSRFSPSLHIVDDPSHSLLGYLGAAIAPAFEPLGFGNWQASIALLSGFAAKEAIASSLCITSGLSDELPICASALSSVFPTSASAASFLVFVALSVPCIAALSSMYHEIGLKLTLLSAVRQLLFAYVSAFAVFHLFSLFI